MKTLRKTLLTGLFLMITAFTLSAFADGPMDSPPPPPGGGHGSGGNQAGAPIDGGMSILLVLGAGYGLQRLYRIKKSKEEIAE